ncbi:MarR family winged helix-turn-helix transcriptional regulator [Nocardia mangyaensis]|uniref:MarR family winged helix-turn-helix transcriptional regulator n=1 Tax=Nocardia mangyaensis TaxID=2213200 RepID=UPI0026770026|nr:MarR family transcriptional regulator [Nocardia mangyaensis]MDO3650703.1 MarR family transcriptional regulator [Nocardia mangyaensis]
MTTPTPYVRALAGELSLSAVRFTRRLRGRRADPHISLTQLSALSTLVRDGAMTPGTLASRECVQPPSMTRVIATLTDRKLVDRSPHPSDGRQILIAASRSGRALISDEANAREEWLTTQLAKLPAEKIAVLTQAVRILTEIAAHREPATPSPTGRGVVGG